MTKGSNHLIVEIVALRRIGTTRDFIAEFLVS